jgi:Na+/proline symporter
VLYCFSALGEGAYGDLGHKCEPFFVRGRGLPWRLIVLVVGVTCMLYCLVGFPGRILVELSLLMFSCGSCPFCL